MRFISCPSFVDGLFLSAPVKSFVDHELIQSAFGGDLKQANQFWKETGTRLYHVLPSDTLDELRGDECRLLRYPPEFILKGPDDYYLLLVVTQDDGGGVYVLFPRHSACSVLNELARQTDE